MRAPRSPLFPTRRSSDLTRSSTGCVGSRTIERRGRGLMDVGIGLPNAVRGVDRAGIVEWAKRAEAAGFSSLGTRSEEHTSELQSPDHLVCRLLLEKKKGWELVKRRKLRKGVKWSTHAGLPPTIPTLLYDFWLYESASGIGFDWPNAMGAWAKMKEE